MTITGSNTTHFNFQKIGSNDDAGYSTIGEVIDSIDTLLDASDRLIADAQSPSVGYTIEWDGSDWVSGQLDTAGIATGAVTSAKILDDTIVNADINSAAAIAYSKLNLASSITSADIVDGTIVNADVNASAAIDKTKISGTAVTIADTGTVTSTMLLDGTILNADVNASAAISYSKLNLATSIVNADVSTSAAIAYSKLNLALSIVNADISASAAIVDTKLATISTASKVSNSATTATNANTASAIVARDASGNFTAGTVTAALTGNASTATKATNISGGLGGSVPYQTAVDATALLANGTAGQVLSSAGTTLAPTWVTATNANTASAIVKRDASGNFTAGTITAALTGNASTATTATSATTATNLAGGAGGSIPYQSAASTTAMLANGTSGQILTSNGTTLAPSFQSISSGSVTLAGDVTGAANANTVSYTYPGHYVCTSSTRPTGIAEGHMIYETDTQRFLAYSGSAWVSIFDTDNWSISGAALVGTAEATTGFPTITLNGYNDDSGSPEFFFLHSRGIINSPTAVASGDRLGRLRFYGRSSTTTTGEGASIFATTEEAWTATALGTGIRFNTATNGTTSALERLRIANDGFVTITGALGRGAPVTKTADFTVDVAENWLINNKAASSCTVTLPTASSWTGREIMIKNLVAFTVISATSNVKPIGTNTAGTAILPATAGTWCTLVSDGTNWIVMQSGPGLFS